MPPLPACLRGERPARSKKSGQAASELPPLTGPANERFERLREFRRELASEAGKPAYTFFNDATAHELASRPPKSRGEFLATRGLGEGKWEKFGAELLGFLGGLD